MERWLFLASDYAACIRDTRALALEHGFIWFSSVEIPPPLPGDRLLLAFKLHRQCLFVPLAKFVIEAREARRLERARSNSPAIADLPEQLRGDFQDASRGSGNGTGYNTIGRSKIAVLCVKKVDPFDDVWSGVSGPHAFPEKLKFGLAEDADSDRPYLVRFSPELLSAPLLPEPFHP